jgi:iron complex transport system substrate-binding protein
MMNNKAIRKTLLLFFLAILTILATVSCNRNTPSLVSRESTATRSPVETQVVNDAFGQVTIPLYPKRIVVLDDHTYLDPILSLDIKPVGIVSCHNCWEDYRGIPGNLVDDISNVGTIEQPSLEAVLKLKPDLILASDFQKESYPQLSAIAPTVGIDYFDVVNFKDRLRYFAQILGRSDRAREVLSQYEERLQNLQQELGTTLETETVSVIYFFDSQNFTVYKPDDLNNSQILNDLGLQFTQAQESQIEHNLKLGIEALPNYDADHIFIVTNSWTLPEDELTESSILDMPIWSTMKAFQERQVYFVNWDIGGPIGANRVIDDLYKYLVNAP